MSQERPYLLRCFNTPLEGGNAVIEDFTAHAERVSRRVRRQGGFWALEWAIPLKEGADAGYLREWFNDRLMCRVRQYVGGSLIWEGVIWEMELSLHGIKRRRSMDDLYNAVTAVYMDNNGDTQDSTTYTDDDSISQYGRRENNRYLSEVDTAQAEAEAQRFLQDHSTPWPRPVRIDPEMQDGLFVYAVGDAYTSNSQYVAGSHIDDSTVNISTFVSDVVANDCQFLTAGNIEENTLQVTKTLTMPARAWEVLVNLADAGDASFNPWRVWVDEGGRVNYEQDDNEPLYEWRHTGRPDSGAGILTNRAGEGTPYVHWSIQPAVLRDLTMPRTGASPNANLQDARDAWIAEVEMADGLDAPQLIPDEADADDMLRAQQRYRQPPESGADVGALLAQADELLEAGF